MMYFGKPAILDKKDSVAFRKRLLIIVILAKFTACFSFDICIFC